jgi:hypothetical protein
MRICTAWSAEPFSSSPSARMERTYSGVTRWMDRLMTSRRSSVPRSSRISSRMSAADAPTRASVISSRSVTSSASRMPRERRVDPKPWSGRKRKWPEPRPWRKVPSISNTPASRSMRKVAGVTDSACSTSFGTPARVSGSTDCPQLLDSVCRFSWMRPFSCTVTVHVPWISAPRRASRGAACFASGAAACARDGGAARSPVRTVATRVEVKARSAAAALAITMRMGPIR